MNDEETDALIRDAMRDDEQRLAKSMDESLAFTEEIIHNFRGRRRWLTIFPIFLSLVYTAGLVWCLFEFFDSEVTKNQIAWACGFLVCAVSVGLVKIWVWGEWQRNSLAREIKRVEIQVAKLSEKLENGDR